MHSGAGFVKQRSDCAQAIQPVESLAPKYVLLSALLKVGLNVEGFDPEATLSHVCRMMIACDFQGALAALDCLDIVGHPLRTPFLENLAREARQYIAVLTEHSIVSERSEVAP